MPNRILKDSICTSEDIAALDWAAEVFWYRLIVQCDDFGRMDARPAILRARCYPLAMDRVKESDIARWLKGFQHSGMVQLYTVNDKPYLQITTWAKHQQMRAQRSKYPPMISDDVNGNQMISDAPENRESESESESESENRESENPKRAATPPPPPAPKVVSGNGHAPTPKTTQTITAQQEMFGALADVCQLDANLKAAQIGKTSAALLKAGYTAAQVAAFSAWWLADMWRAEHTPVPTLYQVADKLKQSLSGPPRQLPQESNVDIAIRNARAKRGEGTPAMPDWLKDFSGTTIDQEQKHGD